jgi:hypothetical protein
MRCLMRLAGCAALAVALAGTSPLPGWPAAQAAAAQAAAAPPPASPVMSDCPHGMNNKETSHFRVFACNNGPSAARDEQSALSDLAHLLGPETSLMGPPVPDNEAAGEKGRIDVYLVATGQTLKRGSDDVDLTKDGTDAETPWDAINGTVSSAFIVSLRPEALPHGASFNSVLAHELFHVLQYSHNTTLSCVEDGRLNFWFLEASAVWAEWYFAPASAGTMVYPWFREFQAKPDISLTDAKTRSPYGDWTWPLFMQQQAGPESIAGAWKAMAGKTGCTALNAAVNQQVPFHDHFGDFAVEDLDYRLPNLKTGARAWPTGFGRNYPRFRASANPAAPAFPEVLPKHDLVALDQNNYPYSQTVKVDLPPLSSTYDEVPVLPAADVGLSGQSIEFDFSHLSHPGYLDISLVAANHEPNGHAVHNGVWQRIDLSGGDLHAKICLDADGTNGNYPVDGTFYVVLDNHSSGPSAAPVTGSYKVYQRTACATALAGTLTVSETQNNDGFISKLQQNAVLKIKLADTTGAFEVMPGSTWSEQYNATATCNLGTQTASAAGAGKLTDADLDVADPAITITLMYSQPYSVRPWLNGVFLTPENAQTSVSGSNCGLGSVVPLQIGAGCPVVAGPEYTIGVYTARDAGVNFACSSSATIGGVTVSETVTGILTATDPVDCGLWTKNCSIGS